ncbi:hypothetical protein [Cohnella endophytica]|uniref:hypothetical protein n=1 Tax=Cohnella endophytica TaxID=2419778 RepID=UPI0011C3A4F7|nr:hypothetical protein [Cohnella endophytica]
MKPVTAEAVALECRRPALAIVTHPYWIEKAASLHPERLLALIPDNTFEEYSELWKSRLAHCVLIADLFGSESESLYLEQAFKKEAVLLLRDADHLPSEGQRESMQGSSAEFEVLLRQAVSKLLTDNVSPVWATALQQHTLVQHYSEIRKAVGPHETASFLLAVYEYLLKLPDAASHLLESFLHAQQSGREDCIRTHYRFLSAIHAQNDELREAIDAYGVTALSADDRLRYERICEYAENGRADLAAAWLLRENDDLVGALARLHGAYDSEATDLKYRWLVESSRWEEALALSGAAGISGKAEKRGHPGIRDERLLNGYARKLRGDRHEAIRFFLEAAELDQDAIGLIARIKSEDAAIARLRRNMLETGESEGLTVVNGDDG